MGTYFKLCNAAMFLSFLLVISKNSTTNAYL
ncbi:hypothetical protein MHIR_DE00604 [Candidatus Doolittlea endobia]|uniref:Uncharacterized protein n=1 Tax=Candidatus Doolittlea endobia TaxID=1778262 RepID=A0A143WST6_9ENTR|nr:hypothetical protein MHIR_DE00604 [Candidatus Doolittlea endobia]